MLSDKHGKRERGGEPFSRSNKFITSGCNKQLLRFCNIHVFPLISEWEQLSVALYQTSHRSFTTAEKHTQFYLAVTDYFRQDYLFSLISCLLNI